MTHIFLYSRHISCETHLSFRAFMFHIAVFMRIIPEIIYVFINETMLILYNQQGYNCFRLNDNLIPLIQIQKVQVSTETSYQLIKPHQDDGGVDACALALWTYRVNIDEQRYALKDTEIKRTKYVSTSQTDVKLSQL